ncbi:MAG: hypothetical protein AB7F50_05000 [Fimbriimonadaceae bacterium]
MLSTAILAALCVLAPASGLQPREYVVAFEPHHVAGPFAGTKTCPVCQFPLNPGVMVWVGDETESRIEALAIALERKLRTENRDRQGTERLVAFMVFLESPTNTEARLRRIADSVNVRDLALTLLPPDSSAVATFEINRSPWVKTTTLVYREAEVSFNFVNLSPSRSSALEAAIDAVLKN